jgi:hypothetical protein
MCEVDEKLKVMDVAAKLTEAVMGHDFVSTGNVGTPGVISDTVRSKMLMAWEVFRSYYHGIVTALPLDDPLQGWPMPSPAAPAVKLP